MHDMLNENEKEKTITIKKFTDELRSHIQGYKGLYEKGPTVNIICGKTNRPYIIKKGSEQWFEDWFDGKEGN